MTTPDEARSSRDRGSGVVTSAGALLAFLLFLLLSVQLLVGLHASTVVSGATSDAAHLAAGHRVDHTTAQGRGEVEDHLRDLLGDEGGIVTIDWTGTTADLVVLTVTVPRPRIGFGLLSPDLLGDIERMATVRAELSR